ncbi:MAG TPA: hypothetical protein VE890_17750, partial [Thermoguttaceae bacterium]|nr:hypothetical protein [Thermoguttaceae bacterium]
MGTPLDKVYSADSFKVTLTECSSSLMIRSEHQYNWNDRQRLSLRKHIHELNSDQPFPVAITAGIRQAIRKQLERVSAALRLGEDGLPEGDPVACVERPKE